MSEPTSDGIEPAQPPSEVEEVVAQTLELGIRCLHAGDAEDADKLFTSVLRIQPGNVVAHYGAALVLMRSAAHEQALEHLTVASAAEPGNGELWIAIVECLLALGRTDEARHVIETTRAAGLDDLRLEALACRAGSAPALNTLQRLAAEKPAAGNHPGNRSLSLHLQRGEWRNLAEAALLNLDQNPGDGEDWHMLGIACLQQNHTGAARFALAEAAARLPRDAEVWDHLGIAERLNHNFERARQCFASSLRLAPRRPETWVNQGNLQFDERNLEGAQASFKHALQLRPDFPPAIGNLGNVLRETGKLAEAAECYRRLVATCPDLAEAHCNLGNVERDTGALDAAIASYRQAIALKPQLAEAHSGLGRALVDRGRIDEAIGHYETALQLRPDFLDIHSNLLKTIAAWGRNSPEVQLEFAKRYGAELSRRSGKPFGPCLLPEASAPLRVGFVSGDLRQHPVGYFLANVVRHINPQRVELHAFSTLAQDDALSAELRRSFASWSHIGGMSDAAAAEHIHRQGIHLLVDLSGHTAHHRLGVFAWRPAPVQASWLGYFATTGVAEMDYFLADPYVAPAGDEAHFCETIWRLPESYLCFTPPAVALQPGPLPALENGYLTFGCFNHLNKLNDAVIDAWSSILRQVPSARLFLKTALLDDRENRNDTVQRFAQRGIAAERLILEAHSPRAELLAAYQRVDIALDPFPYPGGTTSVEALWMGVPVLTRRGDYFLARVGETIARNAGMDDWIANDDEHYAALALAHSSNPEGLARLRAGLRERLLASPLFDAPRFASNLESAFRQMFMEKLSPPTTRA